MKKKEADISNKSLTNSSDNPRNSGYGLKAVCFIFLTLIVVSAFFIFSEKIFDEKTVTGEVVYNKPLTLEQLAKGVKLTKGSNVIIWTAEIKEEIPIEEAFASILDNIKKVYSYTEKKHWLPNNPKNEKRISKIKKRNKWFDSVKPSNKYKIKMKRKGVLIIDKQNLENNTEYDPIINPLNFSSEVNNKYFVLIPGKKMVYEGKTKDGLEKVEVYVMDEKRVVMGVETIVVWDRVWLDGELIEDTKDWYAQDNEGNVWYFGEESYEMLDGKIVSIAGSWEAGIDGAKPGIIMKASPKVGDSYKQEYYKGKAEDMAEILSLNETVSVKYDNFKNCLKTLDYTPLAEDVKEHKYYCPTTGGIVLEIDLDSEERAELVSLEYNTQPSPSIIERITEEEAKEIALKKVSGIVTDVSIEKKFGKVAYVVEINNGDETDVIIDINTGKVLGVEK